MKNIARIIIFISISILGLYSCKSIQYVPFETVKYDTTYVSRLKVDSIYHKDYIYMETKGDTVFKYRYVYRNKIVERKDTVWRMQSDTIRVVEYVEKSLTKWQKARIHLGSCLIIIGAAAILYILIRRKKGN